MQVMGAAMSYPMLQCANAIKTALPQVTPQNRPVSPVKALLSDELMSRATIGAFHNAYNLNHSLINIADNAEGGPVKG